MESQFVCSDCSLLHTGKTKMSFLGFRNFHCSLCGSKNTRPLSTTYRVIYVLAIVFFLFCGTTMLLAGRIPIPGILAVAAVWALIHDNKLIKRARESASGAGGGQAGQAGQGVHREVT